VRDHFALQSKSTRYSCNHVTLKCPIHSYPLPVRAPIQSLFVFSLLTLGPSSESGLLRLGIQLTKILTMLSASLILISDFYPFFFFNCSIII